MASPDYSNSKSLVRQFYADFDSASETQLQSVLERYTSPDYHWRGMHPFYEKDSAAAAVRDFWQPLRASFGPLQRREDIFLSGSNDAMDDRGQWVCSMGHLLGQFDRDWLGIPATGKMLFLRYAEFHRVENNRITEAATFCDIISVMQQAGLQPLPQQTGAAIIPPGPRTHDGILLDPQAPEEGQKTMDLVNRMVADLSALNVSGDDRCPPELLANTWHDDMLWYGPAGIGSSYTIRRYQLQHQYPFREGLENKVFNGHVARFAEGHYACFFGWANLTNSARGGFLGMTGNQARADMRVVDVYRRDGDKLAENWVIIDLLHYLSMQGLDVLKRMRSMQL